MSNEARAVTLETVVDTTGARAGFNEISREAGTMASAVARASGQADHAVGGVGAAASSSSRNVEVSQRNMIAAIQRTAAAMESGGRTGAAYYEVLARQRGVDPAVLEPYLKRLRELEQAQHRAAAAAAENAQANGHVGLSAAQINQELRFLPNRFQSIADSITAGQRPTQILIQQGGELVSSFGGLGTAVKAVGGYLLGLINPYVVVGAAAGGLALIYKRGIDEMAAYNKAVITSGNAAGTTARELSEMARQVAATTGSRGEAASVLNGLVQTGQVQAKNLEVFAEAAIEAQRIIGRSVEESTADFEKLGRAPLQSLDDIDKKYHFVDASTRSLVKSLQEQGRMAEAANVAQNAYADGITKQKQAVLESLTEWERGWIRIKTAISGAVDSALSIREATNQERINDLLDNREKIEENLRRAQARGLTANVAMYQAELDNNERLINQLRDRTKATKDAAEADSARVRAKTVTDKWEDESNLVLTRRQQMEKELRAAEQEGLDNHLKDEEIQKRLAVIRVKYNDVYVQGVQAQIDAINRRAAIEEQIAQREKMRLSGRRAAGEISEEDALHAAAQQDLDALDRRKKKLEAERDAIKTKRESEPEVRQKQSEIDLISELKATRLEQLNQDLAEFRRKDAQATEALYVSGLAAAQDERESLLANVKAQKQYNEELGLSSAQVLELRARRTEDLAVLKDQTAEFLAATEGGEALAKVYRDQAAALRAGSAAEREGFMKSQDPYVNLRISLNRYVEESQNSGGLIGDALTNAFRSAEDAFATFVTTGKLNFRDLANGIIADFARIEAKAAIGGFAKGLIGSFGADTTSGWGSSLMKAFGVSGARANGGPVNSGLSYLVGERGPEIFTPSNSGSITPNHLIGSGGGGGAVNINLVTNVSDGGSSSQTSGASSSNARAAADALNAKMKAVIAQETRQGGIIWKLQQGRG